MYALIGLGEPQPTVACRGWEKDPESFSKRVAEHYARTVLGKSMSARRSCRIIRPEIEIYGGAICTRPGSRRQLREDPDYVIALRLRAQPSGPARYYTYSCTPDGNLILSEQKKPSAVPASPTMRVAQVTLGEPLDGWAKQPRSRLPQRSAFCALLGARRTRRTRASGSFAARFKTRFGWPRMPPSNLRPATMKPYVYSVPSLEI